MVFAVMLLLSGMLLFYTAAIVPVQICMWNYDDPCNIFPTLHFDIIVDTFFLVPLARASESSPRAPPIVPHSAPHPFDDPSSFPLLAFSRARLGARRDAGSNKR